ncbi:hypothetical protein AAE478_001620 [Parahypoxylon ruwenzoriense]
MAGEVRHPIDTKALERYLSDNVPEIKVPLEVKQFGFGQSNPTYQLTSIPTGSHFVLRKKPAGKLLSQAAHKVEREYRIIRALGAHPTGVPVPRAFCLCEDASVLGTPFYVMSFVGGRIFEDPAMPDAKSPGERTLLWKAAVEALAALHRVDPEAVGLGSFGGGGKKRSSSSSSSNPSSKSSSSGKGGFYDRQLATWSQICAAQARTRDIETGEPVGALPHMEELLAYFSDASLQPRDRATLVHGDYKIDNLVFAAGEARVAGILDWEMSTVGHPLSDLSNLMYPFRSAAMSSSTSSSPTVAPSTSISNPAFLPNATPGLPAPADVLSWYAAAAGWAPTPEEVAWAAAFGVFRLAAICQGIAARFATRQASSANAHAHASAARPLGEFAWKLVSEQREKRGGKGGAKL